MPYTPTISVIVTTYNYAHYLPRALNSVLQQTYPHFEVIVVNDGSTDNTDEIIKPYIDYPKLRYYKKSNGGQASAKNYGIKKADGDYIAFLDADDFWEAKKLMLQVELFEKNSKIGVVYSDIRMINPEGDEIPFKNPERFRGSVLPPLFGNNFIPFSTSVIRREILEEYGGFDESISMGIDYDMWLRFSLVTQFDYVCEVLVACRVGHERISSNVEGRVYWVELIEKRFREKHPTLVGKQMMRDCEFGKVYTAFRRSEKTHRLKALRSILQMFSLRPLSNIPYKSLGRFILIGLLSFYRDRS